MKIDPKTNKGDLVASVNAMPGTEMQIAGRFENCPEYALHSYVCPLIEKLVVEGCLRKCKNGMIYATKKGVDYIKERGYFD